MPDEAVQIAILKTRLDAVEQQLLDMNKKLDQLLEQRIEERGMRRVLTWVGLAIVAAAGGTGAFVAKLLGWITIK